MIIIGADFLAERFCAEPLRQHKALQNEAGMIILPASLQHSSIKVAGISYEDDYKGNALAVIFDANKMEIRWHSGFSEERVRQILKGILARPELEAFEAHLVTYQGRVISV